MARGRVAGFVLLTASLALVGGLIAHAASEDSHRSDCTTAGNDAVECRFTHQEPGAPGDQGHPGTPAVQPANGPPRTSTPVDPERVHSWEVKRNAAGQPCWVESTRPQGADPAAAQRAADQAYIAQSGGDIYPPCPIAETPATSASPATPGFVRTADVAARLGSPAPRIQPGRAIAGKLAFLELGGPGARSFDLADPLGGPGAHVEAHPTYRVDWGDGTVTETTSSGGPWPRGDVTHTYQRTGHYDVVVTARWAARWTSGADGGGDLSGLTTEGRIARFPVTEVQAVRER
jgi:hypothetical protein